MSRIRRLAAASMVVVLSVAACGDTEAISTTGPDTAGASGKGASAGTGGSSGAGGSAAVDAGPDAADASEDSPADAGHDHADVIDAADAGPCVTGLPDVEARIEARHRQALAGLLEGFTKAC